MEADWEIEIGGDAPVIEADWPGFIDLRLGPERANQLPEGRRLPGLAEALIRLNATISPVWTSKCDVFELQEFDCDELDAEPGATHAWACYVDLLPRSDQQWTFPAKVVSDCKALCGRLHGIPLRNCRVDLVIRCVLIAPDVKNLGITAYLSACGATAGEASAVLQEAVSGFADAILPVAHTRSAASKLQ